MLRNNHRGASQPRSHRSGEGEVIQRPWIRKRSYGSGKIATLFVVVSALLAPAAAKAQESVGLGGGGATGGPAITANGVMFVACDMFGTYRSTNAGKDWRMLDARDVVSADGSGVFSVAVDPRNPKHVFAFHPLQGVKESFAEGADGTWTRYRPSVAWTPGPAVASMAISAEQNPTVLLGTNGGVYRIQSSGAGSSWQHVGSLSEPVLKVLFVADAGSPTGQRAFAATSGGIHRLEEGPSKAEWKSVAPASGWQGPVTDLVGASDSVHYVLYAAVGRQSVYRYDSGGMPAEWQQFKDSDECFQPNLLGMPRNALNTVYATSSSGSCQKRAVFRGSFDAKKMSWTPAYDVGTVAGGWMENFPGYGRGWGFGGPARGFAVHPSDPDIAVLTNLGGVYVTLNGGKSWIQRYTAPTEPNRALSTTRSNGLDVTSVWNHYRRGARTFLANTDIGMAVRDDGGQWVPISSDGTTSWNTFYELAIDAAGGRIWAAVSQEHDIPYETQLDDTAPRNRTGAVLVSVDTPRDRAGRTWTRMRTGPNHGILPPGPVVSVLYRAPHLYASVWGAGVFRSTPDAGGAGDWIRWGAPPNTSNKHFYQLHSDAGGNIYVAMAAEKSSAPCASSTRKVTMYSPGALYRLGPSPESAWTLLTSGLPPISPVDFTFDPAQAGVLYVATRDTRSGDPKTCKLSTWVDNAGVATGGLWRLVVDGSSSQPPAHVLSIETPNAGGGGPVASPDYQLSLQAFSPAFLGDALYVATVGHGVLRSYDRGKTWSRAFRGLPFLATQRLGFDSTGTIYVTTFGGGAWLLFSPSW